MWVACMCPGLSVMFWALNSSGQAGQQAEPPPWPENDSKTQQLTLSLSVLLALLCL